MIEFELSRGGFRPRIRAEADTLPLMADLVMQGLGYTVLPSCGVYSLVKAGRLSASPILGLRITWTIARPINRSLSVAARLLFDIVFQVVHDMVETGAWPLAEIERDRRGAVRKLAPKAAIPVREPDLRREPPAKGPRRPQRPARSR